ncbi:hypothetical protein N9H59_03315 [Flavobacteriaceae bacterium]|nr:hypothetical protein [Flavobacteriaceae bacterium]
MTQMPCLYCKKPLGLTLEFIQKNPVSQCPHCKTTFNFATSIDVMGRFNEVQREMEEIKNKYKSIAKFN